MPVHYLTHSAELYHTGVRGMHWGERRYQYEDGSLTPEGRIRYGRGQGIRGIKAKEAQKIERRRAKEEYRNSDEYKAKQERNKKRLKTAAVKAGIAGAAIGIASLVANKERVINQPLGTTLVSRGVDPDKINRMPMDDRILHLMKHSKRSDSLYTKMWNTEYGKAKKKYPDLDAIGLSQIMRQRGYPNSPKSLTFNELRTMDKDCATGVLNTRISKAREAYIDSGEFLSNVMSQNNGGATTNSFRPTAYMGAGTGLNTRAKMKRSRRIMEPRAF